jgi:WD40 repeat protein
MYLFADDPDSDWSPFQKLNPSLPITKAQRTAAKPAISEAEEIPFTIPALQEPETVWSVAFSPCGNYLASGGDGGGIRIWERR